MNDPLASQRAQLSGTVAPNALHFGEGAGGQYWLNQQGINNTLGQLQALANGQNSVSALQLRQGLQQQLAGQQSMAAGASPQNQLMAARNAASNMMNLGSGLAGQQALAGLQERNAAWGQMAGLQQAQAQMNLQGALGGYNAATGAYGAAMQNPPQTWQQQYLPLIGSGLSAGGSTIQGLGAAGVLSDERAKKNVKPGDADAKKALGRLNAVSYDYKDDRNGKGKQFGIMAQDLEKAGLGHAVIDTSGGKLVHAGKAAAAALGLAASMHRRLNALEARK